MKRRAFMMGAVCSSLMRGAHASPLTTPLKEAQALNGHSFRIDAVEYRLSDIAAPLHVTASPHAQRSTAVLSDLLRAGVEELRETAPPDRWNRKVVIASRFSEGGEKISLQSDLLARGAAWVQPETTEETFIAQFLKTEAEARKKDAGLWVEPAYSVCDALDANSCVGAYRLVEGIVKKTASPRSRTYLNFGDDYRTDFTATLKKSARP